VFKRIDRDNGLCIAKGQSGLRPNSNAFTKATRSW
jgi:hypothetical protein